MKRICAMLVLACALGGGGALAQEPPVAPSGATVRLHEALLTEEGMLYLSFVVPALSEPGITYDLAETDMAALCASEGLARARESGEPVSEVVIRLMASAIDYGTTDPAVSQFAGVYDISHGSCDWM